MAPSSSIKPVHLMLKRPDFFATANRTGVTPDKSTVYYSKVADAIAFVDYSSQSQPC